MRLYWAGVTVGRVFTVRSVLETARRRGIATLHAIRLTLDETALAIPP